jgi:chaperone required for assembly of F1-ATPase
MTGLANAAIDRVAPDCAAFAANLAKYAEADLACYRAEAPQALADRQAAEWDRLLGWARRRFDVDFAVTTGITHVEQPAATVERLGHAVAALDAFQLAGLSPMVTAGGSLIAALAVLDDAWEPDKAWDAVSVDDAWQRERWGSDEEAEKALAGRKADFLAGARFLRLLSA